MRDKQDVEILLSGMDLLFMDEFTHELRVCLVNGSSTKACLAMVCTVVLGDTTQAPVLLKASPNFILSH